MLDVNRDGRDDLLMVDTTTTPGKATIHVGLGREDGTLDFSRVSQDHPAIGESWGLFTLLTGDFNGDGSDDIVFNNADANNTIYVGLAK